MFNNVLHNTLAQGSSVCTSASCHLHGHPCRAFDLFSLFLTLFLSVCSSYPFFFLNPELNLFLHVVVAKAIILCASAKLGVWALWPNTTLSQAMSPCSLTTSTTRRLLKSSSRSNPATRCPRTCLTPNSTMRPSVKRSLHHCSFRSEKNQRTEDKLITLLKKGCCQLSPFVSVIQVRGDPCTNLVRAKNENQVAKWRTKESGFSLKDKKEQILAEVRTEIHKHDFRADSDRRSIQELSGIIESQRREIDHTLACDEQLRRDQQLLHEQLSENRDLREVHMKSLRWKNWSGFKGRHSMNFREEDWSKIETLSLNSRPKFRNYRMKFIAWMIGEILKMLSQYEVDYPTFPVNQLFFHFIVILAEC